MNMVKSLLLGSAAGVVAVAGAQAADLPVKAKPVEYVKVCSAYGAGFYYIPGTDICLRVGGFIFANFDVNNFAAGPGNSQAIGGNLVRNRNDDWTDFRVRQDLILDARTNTEYGTLRSYASVGWQWTTNFDGFRQQQQVGPIGNYQWYYDRAFIQFAGLTFGYVGSFFDYDPSMILSQQYSKSFKFAPAIAYTAQFGNGISASISMEDSTTRRTVIQTATGSLANGTLFGGGYGYYAPAAVIQFGCTTGNTNLCGDFLGVGINVDGWSGTDLYAGQYMPDFIGNIRVDQAWGDAQISGAVHQVKTAIQGVLLPGQVFVDAVGGAPAGGVPWAATKYGFAALAGINLKLPMLGAGDSFQIEGAWAKGAPEYTGIGANPYQNVNAFGYRKGQNGPVIAVFDSYVNANGQALSTAWSLNAQLRHFWTPTIRSTIAYGYNKFNAPAAAQNPLNAQGVVGSNAPNGFIANFPDGKVQQVSANLIWSPVPKLDLGLEAVWNRLETDCAGLSAANCGAAAEATRGKSTDIWGGTFRARRDF